MRKIITVVLLVSVLTVFFAVPCFANGDVTITQELYEYTIPTFLYESGEFGVRGIFGSGSDLYFVANSKSNEGKYVLVSAKTGQILLNNLDFINYYSEYSDMVYCSINGKYAVYDIINQNNVCDLGNVFGLSYGGRFSEDGGFFTLSDRKLHYVGNNGVVGNAVDIDYNKYKSNGYTVSTWDYLGNDNFKLVLQSGREYYEKTLGIVNSSGEVLVYADNVYVLYDDYYIIERYKKYGIVDKDGNEIAPCIYSSITGVESAFTDCSKYSSVSSYNDGLILSSGFKYGITDPKNKIDMSLNSRYTHYYFSDSDGISVMCFAANSSDSGIYGCMDNQGNVLIPFEYEYLSNFSEELAVAKKNGKYGYIDKEGNVIIPFMYLDASPFENGEAYVLDENNKKIKIDKNNEIVEEDDDEVIFVPKYRLTENIDTKSKSHYTGGIELTGSGKVVDISSLKVWPVVLGAQGDFILAFSSDFDKMYKLNITDDSPHIKSTVKLSGKTITASIDLVNFDTSSTVIVVTYKGEILAERKVLKSTDDLTNIQLNSNCDKIKIMVWDNTENIAPLMYSDTVPKSQWILN